MSRLPRLLLLTLSLSYIAYATIKPTNIFPANATSPTNKHITILDQKELHFNTINGLDFSEISDLAYDHQTKKLYMVSDEGLLFTFKANFHDTKIPPLTPLQATILTKKGNKPFQSWQRDSEGLDLDHKGNLIVSFEETARISHIDPNGTVVTNYQLPKKLLQRKNYRSKNKLLESLVYHPHHGILYACEWPLRPNPKKRHTIYTLGKKEWQFQAEPETRSGITAIEVLQDGNLLILERSYSNIFNPLVITLKKVYLNQQIDGINKSKILAKFNTHKGWKVDNFEGLTQIDSHRYLMISDNNHNPILQKTLLVLFEVHDE
jgi:hypothetical protein